MSFHSQKFAEFADSLSFIKNATDQDDAMANNNSTEKDSLVPNLTSWVSTHHFASSLSTAPSQTSTPAPSVYGGPAKNSGKFGHYGVQSLANSGFTYIKKGLTSARGSAIAAASRAQENVEEAQTSLNRYWYFGVLALAGAFLIFLSFLFLPLVVLAPQKFALLFTIGSLFMISALAVLKGVNAFISHLIDPQRAVLSFLYFLSMGATLYVTLEFRSYLLTILFAGFQLLFLLSFLISYLAGGTRVLNYMKSIPLTVMKKVFFSTGGDILPL